MNTKTHGFKRPVAEPLSDMQAAELAWWKKYLDAPTARHRMYSLYGVRYGDWFWDELIRPGNVVEFGSGPLPVFLATGASTALAVDTLMREYIAAGLVTDVIRWVADAEEVPTGEYDTALLFNVLDHAEDPQALVNHAARSINRDGQVLVFVHLDAAGDDKHRKVTSDDVGAWLHNAGLAWTRQEFRPATQYDPRAYLCVARRADGS